MCAAADVISHVDRGVSMCKTGTVKHLSISLGAFDEGLRRAVLASLPAGVTWTPAWRRLRFMV